MIIIFSSNSNSSHHHKNFFGDGALLDHASSYKSNSELFARLGSSKFSSSVKETLKSSQDVVSNTSNLITLQKSCSLWVTTIWTFPPFPISSVPPNLGQNHLWPRPDKNTISSNPRNLGLTQHFLFHDPPPPCHHQYQIPLFWSTPAVVPATSHQVLITNFSLAASFHISHFGNNYRWWLSLKPQTIYVVQSWLHFDILNA